MGDGVAPPFTAAASEVDDFCQVTVTYGGAEFDPLTHCAGEFPMQLIFRLSKKHTHTWEDGENKITLRL